MFLNNKLYTYIYANALWLILKSARLLGVEGRERQQIEIGNKL